MSMAERVKLRETYIQGVTFTAIDVGVRGRVDHRRRAQVTYHPPHGVRVTDIEFAGLTTVATNFSVPTL